MILSTLSAGLLVCATLTAGPFVPQNSTLPTGDALTVTLDPSSGSVDGSPGNTVGWGFDVNWLSTTANGDYLTFTSSSLAYQSNASVILNSNPASYNDLIGPQGGNSTDAPKFMDPNSTWIEPYVTGTLGAGDYPIDPSASGLDTGYIELNFLLTSGNFYSGGQFINSIDNPATQSFSYFVPYSVAADTVPSTPTGAPEPGSLLLFVSGSILFAAMRRRVLPAWALISQPKR